MSKKTMAMWGHLYRDFTAEGVEDEAKGLFETLAGVGVSVYYPFPADEEHAYYESRYLETKQDYLSVVLKTAKEFGDPIPAPKGRRLQFA